MDHLIVDTLRLYPYTLRLARPLPGPAGPLLCREGVLVQAISREGAVGFGDTAPLPGYSRESLVRAGEQLERLVPLWTGRGVPATPFLLKEYLRKSLDRSLLAASVLFGLEGALCQMAAAAAGLSLAAFLSSGQAPGPVTSAILIDGRDEQLRVNAARASAQGARTFKLKTAGGDLFRDLRNLEVLREVVSRDARIRFDAGRAWPLREACLFAGAAGKDRIDYVEDPCREEQEFEAFYRQTDMPWAVDQYVSGALPERWEGATGLRAVVIKPTLRGGVVGTLELVEQFTRAGVVPVISAAFESGVGLTTLANLAALTPVPAGLGTGPWLAEDVLADPLLGPAGEVPPGRLEISARAFSPRFRTMLLP